MAERLDTVVHEPGVRVGGDHPREVAALMPQLGRLGQLARHQVHEVGGRHGRARRDDPEPGLGEAPHEQAGVVAGPVDRTRIARLAVSLEALRALPDGSREEQPGHGRALPPRRLPGQPAGTDRRDAEVGQVLERTDEPRGRDDLVDLERKVAAAVGAPEVHRKGSVTARHGLDALDRGVEDGHAAAQHMVLVRLHVPGTDADQRAGIDRETRGRRRREHQLARPRQQAVGELEPGVLLADDEDALAGVALGFPDVRVVTRMLHAGAWWDVRLGHADGDDERLRAIRPVGGLDD